MARANHYRLFGLAVRSGLPLPELAARPTEGPPDVEIRLGPVAARDDEVAGYNVAPEGTVLYVPDVARFLIRDGREIVVDPAVGASERNVRLYVLGSAFGALLHQRRLLPLHANMIGIDGRGVAFSGRSGAGKSTIAAWFYDRGHPVLADDVCAIATGEDGSVVAFPGVPRLRLWREALEVSGRTTEGHHRSFDDLDKWDVPTSGGAEGQLALDRIYMLGTAPPDAGEPLVRRLAGARAVDALVANTYRGGYVALAGLTASHLAACVAVARSVPVFEAKRVWGFDAFDRQAALLMEHAASPLEPADGDR
jgi:hypothetical protein